MINLFASEKGNQSKIEDLKDKSTEQITKLSNKYRKGCEKIYHEPGYYNSKGDALYDFTCDTSHLCPKCKSLLSSANYELTTRAEQKQKIQDAKKYLTKQQLARKQYFEGKPGCQCTKDHMCKQCLATLQHDVTKYEKGCGKTWQEQFGGMAAGPAWVTCQDNYFLCEDCSQKLNLIKNLNKQYPHVKLQHMPEIEKMFWSPKIKYY